MSVIREIELAIERDPTINRVIVSSQEYSDIGWEFWTSERAVINPIYIGSVPVYARWKTPEINPLAHEQTK